MARSSCPFSSMRFKRASRPDIALQPNDILYVPFSWMRNIAMKAHPLELPQPGLRCTQYHNGFRMSQPLRHGEGGVESLGTGNCVGLSSLRQLVVPFKNQTSSLPFRFLRKELQWNNS